MNVRLVACLTIVCATASTAARAQYWETDAAFAPVIESSTIVPTVTMLPVAGGKVLVVRIGDVDSVNGIRAPLVRLNPDGSTDATFAPPEETALVPKAAYPDGRVLATRTVGTGGSSAEEFMRLTATGAVDPSFTPARLNSGATASAQILGDGRILLAGSFTEVSGSTAPLLCLLNADGSVSTTFHSPLATGQIAFGDGGGIAATPTADGRFIVVGQFFDLGPAKLKNVARLLADGSVDPTFNANVVSFPAPVRKAYSQSDGHVLVTFGPSVMAIDAPSGMYRLTSTGAQDTSFTAAVDGSFVTFGPQQSDGRIFYRSYRADPYRYEVRRLNADGTADPSFTPLAADGSLDLPMPLLGDDGSLWFGAPLTWVRRAAHANITRVQTGGTIAAIFSPRVSAAGGVSAILRQPDGGLVVAGPFDYVNGVKTESGISLVRLAEDGTTDPSFTATLASYEWMDWLHRATDGEMLGVGLTRTMLDSASGATDASGITAQPWRWVSRFSADGTRVADFPVETPQYLGLTITGQISVDETGRLYCVTSDRSDRRYLIRNLPDGALDESLGPVRLSGPGLFAMMPNGDFVVTSELPGDAEGITLTRFSTDRVVDTAFAVDPDELPETLLALVSLPDSSVIAIGSMAAENGRTLMEYVRLNVSGEATHRYRGRAFAGSVGLSQAQEVAGVLFDAMRDAGAAAGAHLTVRLPSALGTVWVDVDREGRLAVLLPDTSGSRLQVLRRTSPTEPSVDLTPSVVSAARLDVATVFIGGRTSLAATGGGLFPLSFQWAKDGVPIVGATSEVFELNPAKPSDAGRYTVTISNAHGSTTSAEIDVPVYVTNTTPAFATNAQPASQAPTAGANATLSAELWGNPLPEVSWHVNGKPFAGPGVTIENGIASSKSNLTLSNLTPANVGLYVARATNSSATIASSPAIVGLRSTTKTLGAGREFRADILHPNGRIFDQVLLEGVAASVTADADQVTRMSYVDLNDDIVQVEFSGAGTVSLTLAGEPGPAAPASHYVQPAVNYMKGHASIVVAGANETSHLSVFTVGRANAIDQTLFRDDVTYDGVADLAYIAILSEDGKFGGLRCANVSFFASTGLTGVYAPDVQFTGPVYVGDIDAFDDAEPVLVLGSATDETQINGGDLSQTNAKPVRVSGLAQLKFVAGVTSHGVAQPAQSNHGRLEQNGVNVTDQIVVNPVP
jgi:uncharacterized delta-60 repeat protein